MLGRNWLMIAHFPHLLTTLRAFRLLLAVLLGLALGPRALALDAAAFDGELREAMVVWGVPGMAVSVVEQGSLVFARGYGTTAVVTAVLNLRYAFCERLHHEGDDRRSGAHSGR